MQIVIDTMQCPCRTLNDECSVSGRECYEDDICSLCPLIMNGGVKLPKEHGRLIDADDIDNHIVGHVDTRSCPTIIEADAPKRRKGTPLKENDSGYNCENWIP